MGFPGAEEYKEDMMLIETDILVPCAGEKSITAKNAPHIKAKVRPVI